MIRDWIVNLAINLECFIYNRFRGLTNQSYLHKHFRAGKKSWIGFCIISYVTRHWAGTQKCERIGHEIHQPLQICWSCRDTWERPRRRRGRGPRPGRPPRSRRSGVPWRRPNATKDRARFAAPRKMPHSSLILSIPEGLPSSFFSTLPKNSIKCRELRESLHKIRYCTVSPGKTTRVTS